MVNPGFEIVGLKLRKFDRAEIDDDIAIATALEARVVVSPPEKLLWCAHAALSFVGLVRLGGDVSRARARPSSPAPRRG